MLFRIPGGNAALRTVYALFAVALLASAAVADTTITEPIWQFGSDVTSESLMFHPTEHKAVHSAVNGAVIVDLNDGSVLTKLRGHTSWVNSVAFSPSGSQVLTGSNDRTARLWDAATGEQVQAFEWHTSEVSSVAFSPDGTRVLTGSAGRAHLWDAATGEQIRVFEGPTEDVSSVAFSPDGTQVLTGSSIRARLWDAATGNQVLSFEGHRGSVNSVAFSPDGARVLTGAGSNVDGDCRDCTARLWGAATGNLIRSFEGHNQIVDSVAFSPDGTQVLTGSRDGTAKMWDADTGDEIRTFVGHTSWVRSVAFSPDGAQVLTGSLDRTARLWDASTGEEIRTFEGHSGGVLSVAFSPDGTLVLTGSADNTARLWDAATGDRIRAFEGHTEPVTSVAFSPDGTQVLTGSADTMAKLWDASTGLEIRAFEGHSGGVSSVAFSPDGTQVLTGSFDDTARLWDASTGTEIRAFEGHAGWVTSVTFSPDGTQVLTGSWDNTARLWDASTGAEIRAFEGHTDEVWSVAFSPDGTQVLTGSRDGTAKMWDADTGDEIRTFVGHTSWVRSVAFSPDGTHVLTGGGGQFGTDYAAQLWDAATSDEIAAFVDHASMVFSVVFSPDGAQILTGSDTRALLWKVQTEVLEIIPDHVGPTNADTISFTIRFEWPVVNFDDASDVVITHDGTAHTGVTITGGPTVYTVTVEGITGDGSFALAVNTESNVVSSSGFPVESSITSDPVLIDNTPPVASITSDFGNGPGQDFTTSISPFPLQGTTDPDTAEVRVNGEPISYTPRSTTWSATLNLVALGPVAEITVVTVDEAGNESAPVTITITYDPLNDADGNGLTDQEEHEIAHLIPTDPLDPLLPRSDWFVSAANGNDSLTAIQGGGTEQNPWRTIVRAMEQLAPLARANFPLRVLLDDAVSFTGDVGPIALYEELNLAFIPFVTVEPAAPGAGGIHIRPTSTANTPVIRAADQSALRGVVVRPAREPDQARALLEINNVAFTVERVSFDGLLRQNSTGIDISGFGSSDSLIRQCRFLNLGTGIMSTNSAVAVSDNEFDNISANSSASRAIAIGFTVLPGKKQGGQTPVLGRVDRILETGFNRFGSIAPGGSAIEFVNVPIEITSAQYNDWGRYTEEEIRARISTPSKQDGDAVDIFPFIPQDKAIIPGGITGVMLDAAQLEPIPMSLAPGVFISDSLSAMAESDGLFFFDVLAGGDYLLTARAQDYEDSPARSVRVQPGRITESPRFLLTGGDGLPPSTPGDVNGNGRVDAVDVQLVINAALGIDIDPSHNADINGDGRVNAVDVQLVINAALGIEINP